MATTLRVQSDKKVLLKRHRKDEKCWWNGRINNCGWIRLNKVMYYQFRNCMYMYWFNERYKISFNEISMYSRYKYIYIYLTFFKTGTIIQKTKKKIQFYRVRQRGQGILFSVFFTPPSPVTNTTVFGSLSVWLERFRGSQKEDERGPLI